MRSRTLHIRPVVLIVAWLGCALGAVDSNAQDPYRERLGVVVIRANDGQGAPIPEASILITSTTGRSSASGRTDAAGLRTFALDVPDSSYTIVVRKIGYTEAVRTILMKSAVDTIRINMVLVAVPTPWIPSKQRRECYPITI